MRFFPVVNWAERGNFGDGNSVPRFHLTWGTGKALVQAVWGAIESHPRRSARSSVRFGSRVSELIVEHDGAVRGGASTAPRSRRAERSATTRRARQGGRDRRRRHRRQPRDRAARMAQPSAWAPPREDPDGLALLRRRGDARRGDAASAATSPTSRACGTTPTRCAIRNPQREHHGLKLIPPRSGVMLDPDGAPLRPGAGDADVRRLRARWSACARTSASTRGWCATSRSPSASWTCRAPSTTRTCASAGSLPFLLGVLLGKPGLVKHFLEGSPGLRVGLLARGAGRRR